MASLYRRILGPAYDTLPERLRQFHEVETERYGQSAFKITRGNGFLRNLIATLAGLPSAGENVPMRLRVVVERDTERWIREFGKQRMESVQRLWRGLLVETLGGITLGFRLVIEGNVLRLQPERVWVLGIPWPRWLAPRITAIEKAETDGCAIIVRAELPVLGLLVQYEGLVQ